MQATARRINSNGKATMLLEMLAKLPLKEQRKIYDQLGERLRKTSQRITPIGGGQPTNAEFFQTELGRYILKEAKTGISIAKVRRKLATITNSLAQTINEEREER